MHTHSRHTRAWIIWLLSSLFLFYKYAIEVSPSVMTAQLMTDFSINGAELGNLAACYFYAYLIMQIPAGLLIDHFGPRRVTTIAIIFCAVGAWILGTTNSLAIAAFGRFLSGLGAAFSALNCLKLISNWFPKTRFALMAGLMMTCGMLGAVGGQVPLFEIIERMGWRSSMKWMGYIGIIIAAIFYAFVEDEPHPYHPMEEEILSLKEGLKSIFKKSQTWLLSLYSGLAFAPVTVFGGLWGVPFLATSHGLAPQAAARAVSMIFIGFAVGAPLMGYLSDRIKSRKKILYFGTVFAFIILSLVLFSGVKSVVILSIFLFLFGFAISGFLLSFTMIKELTAPIFAATAIGFMNTFDAFIGAFSDPLTGKVLDYFWDGKMKKGARVFSDYAYHLSLSVLIVYLFASILLIFFIKETISDDTYPS